MFGKLFMGRNGIDRYSIFIALISLIFFPYPYIRIIGILLLGYAVFRAFSRDLDKRRKELYKFEEINRIIAQYILRVFYGVKKGLKRVPRYFNHKKVKWQQRKQYLFVRCPQCKKTLRLPRNKGRLQATCPVCKVEFMKKT